MSQQSLTGNPFALKEDVTYNTGSIVSKTLVEGDSGTITLFAFDEGQNISEHSAPFEAIVYLLDGEAVFTIGGAEKPVKSGEMLIMPADIPHAVSAKTQFKMMLVMIKNK